MYILSEMPHEIKEFILARIGESYKQALAGETLAIPDKPQWIHAHLYKPKILCSRSIFYAVCEQNSGTVTPFDHKGVRLTDANLAICTALMPSDEYELWGEVLIEMTYSQHYGGNIRGYPEYSAKSAIQWVEGEIPFVTQMGAIVDAPHETEFYKPNELETYKLLLTKGDTPSTSVLTMDKWHVPNGCPPPYALSEHRLQPFAYDNNISRGCIKSHKVKNSYFPDAFTDTGVFIQWARLVGYKE
jgi:hypothetical protein